MKKESSGDVTAVSPAGAIGLMQVMPDTYAELQARYGLGADPFDIRDNVLAGTAYLSEMFDRYGAAGFLAAYNAGPQRWEDHVASGQALPAETISYVAELGAKLDIAVPQIALARSSRPHFSPFFSLIFVDLDGAAVDADPSVNLRERHNDVAGGPAAKSPADSLFVLATTVVSPLPISSSPSLQSATTVPAESSSRLSVKGASSSENGLFAPRSSPSASQ